MQRIRLSFIFLVLMLGSFSYSAFGQQAEGKYWVFFTNKKGMTFNPYKYFDAKAIQRREQDGIPLYDSTDFPVNPHYVTVVKSMVDSASKVTRWFNAIAVYAAPSEVVQLRHLSFVKAVNPMLRMNVELASHKAIYDTVLIPAKRMLLRNQIRRMQGQTFAEKGIDGKGIRIAIFDAGFPTVDTNPAFAQIRKDKRIIKTYDFVKNKDYVYDCNHHGTMVFSCIAGKIGNKQIGMATGASFLLARTEEAHHEPFSEEENWLAAVEWADKNGAQIISSSLGYTFQRYFRHNMNGETSLVSRAANLAAKKGMLVVNAAGNDGTDKWKIISTPADADSVLTVGGISPRTDIHISFSSYGPTADKRLKPNVCAYGEVIAAGEKGLERVMGTSFATPLTAGFAACAWEMNKSWSNMKLFSEIEKSADLYPYYDYAHGYGVPQAGYFTSPMHVKTQATFDFASDSGIVKVVVRNAYFQMMKQKPAKDTTRYSSSHLMYYELQNKNGFIDRYYVVTVGEKVPVRVNMKDYPAGEKLIVHLDHYTAAYKNN